MKKQVQTQLTNTLKKVKTNWQKYQKEKQRILNMHLSSHIKQRKILNIRTKTRTKIHYSWSGYQEKKYAITHKSSIQGLSLQKRKKHKTSDERFYKINRGADKTKIFDKIKKTKRVKYVLIVLKIRMDETDQIIHVSDSYTPIRLNKIDSNEIINNTLEKFNLKKKYEGFTLLSTSIRIIYEGSKKSKTI
jgi:hypothetical protein